MNDLIWEVCQPAGGEPLAHRTSKSFMQLLMRCGPCNEMRWNVHLIALHHGSKEEVRMPVGFHVGDPPGWHTECISQTASWHDHAHVHVYAHVPTSTNF
jgi:hypothetical protein